MSKNHKINPGFVVVGSFIFTVLVHYFIFNKISFNSSIHAFIGSILFFIVFTVISSWNRK